MGKWTPVYTDDVLHAKISTLVSGAIRRVAVEREATSTITYENFVADLDTGDSFTASLIDILVKEIADRRSRQTTSDRSLLCERTVGSLRSLARTSRSYPSNRLRSHGRRSVPNLPDYLAASAADTVVPSSLSNMGGLHELDMMMDDEEEEDFVIDLGATSGGTDGPINSSARNPSPIPDEWHPPPLRIPSGAGPMSGPRWATLNSNLGTTSLLSRQASIRRAARSGVDFTEPAGSTSIRRRYSARETPSSSFSPHTDAPETVTEPRDGLAWARPSLTAQAVAGRRFFPFPRSRRHGSETLSGSRDAPLASDWSDIQPWNAALADEAESASGGETGESELVLIRGSMSSRGPEPTSEQVHEALDSLSGTSISSLPFIPPPYTHDLPVRDVEGREVRSVEPVIIEESTAYPTPGASTEGENVS
ncbi:hypothetical protein CPB83DRAFT_320389 [Crepidotus variabilis]|uniref:Uncharacterized protein n=1 Tax=Crepidotus variabilis TaxID=179855 RepID=A0A9P6JVN1_9AGAR|nr:hypothetical protein CPB83DRAFT_320389 [Crepidotus variabilis]